MSEWEPVFPLDRLRPNSRAEAVVRGCQVVVVRHASGDLHAQSEGDARCAAFTFNGIVYVKLGDSRRAAA